MLRLSLSAQRKRDLPLCAVIAASDHFYAAGLAHPYDPESLLDLERFREHLHRRLADPYSQSRKDLTRIARLLQNGQEVVLRLHEAAVHGPVLAAAVRWMAGQVTPGRLPGRAPAGGLLTPAVELYDGPLGADDELDERRFVWVKGRSLELPGYIWDTSAVITALTPGFGLVKLGRWYGPTRQGRRPLTFFQALALGMLPSHVRPLERPPSDPLLETFDALVQEQRRREAGGSDRDDWRYDPWLTVPDPLDAAWAESVTALEQAMEQEAQAFLALYAAQRPVTFSSAEPVRALGEHVRPVAKTDPSGRRWVLSVERQRGGYLHGWQRAA